MPLGGYSDEVKLWACGCTGATPDGPPCNTAATQHGIVMGGEMVELMCCDGHEPILRLTATHVHDLDSACGLPGAVFDAGANRCFMPEDIGEALLAATTGEVFA